MTVIANAGANVTYAWSGSPIAAFSVTATADDLGGGASFTSQWQIVSQPAGGGASISAPTSNTTNLGPFSAAGTYIFALVIRNNLGVYSEQDYTLMPDSAVKIVEVRAQNSDLAYPGWKEKGGAPGTGGLYDKLHAWFNAVDVLHGKMADVWVSEGVIQASQLRNGFGDNLVLVATGSGYVRVLSQEGDVEILAEDAAIYAEAKGNASVTSTEGDVEFAAVAGAVNISGSAGVNIGSESGDVDLSADVGSLTGGAGLDVVLTAGVGDGASTRRVIARGGAAAVCDLAADILGPDSNNANVFVRGRGTHNYDLQTDIIGSDSDGAGIIVRGRGVHTHDLRTDIIQADTVNTGLWVRSNGSAVCDLRADVILTNELDAQTSNSGITVRGSGTHTADLKVNEIREDTADAGVTIEDVLLKDGYIEGADVWASSGYVNLADWYTLVTGVLNDLNSIYTRTVAAGVVTLGSAAGSETTLLFTAAPNPPAGAKLIISAEFSGANNGNSKTYTLKIGSTTLVTVTTTTTNDIVKLYAELTILGASSQIKRAYFQVNAGAIVEYVTNTSIDLGSGPNVNFCATTPTAADDVVLRQYHISIAPEGP